MNRSRGTSDVCDIDRSFAFQTSSIDDDDYDYEDDDYDDPWNIRCDQYSVQGRPEPSPSDGTVTS
jgi:hypothetical protein